jgi:hypothetical protein
MISVKQLFVRSSILFGLLTVCSSAPLPNPYGIYATSISIGPGAGSGFIIQASNSVYLITARHVLFNPDQNWGLRDAHATCTTHTPDQKTVTFTLDLGALVQSQNIRFSTNHDVALVRFEECNPINKNLVRNLAEVSFQTTNTALWPLDAAQPSQHLSFDQTEVGTDVFIFGYPISVGIPTMPQIDFSMPLLRKGIVAGKNYDRRVYVLDCPSYEGNSGGPVIGKISAFPNDAFFVIGIVTETVPYGELWINAQHHYANENLSNSGYSIAEPIDTVLDLVWQ